jgi:GNAT superfamily N-acetyltransferase
MADVGVRPARAADVAGIARVQLETWRTAYAEMLPEQVLRELTEATVAEHWAAAVQQPPSDRHRVLVAVEGLQIVGFAAFGPADADELGPSGGTASDAAATGLVATLLVEPRWGRRGHGSRLLAATVDLLRADGSTAAVTWLLDRDRASSTFFTSAGWEADGASRALDAGGQFLTEVRLHTALA